MKIACPHCRATFNVAAEAAGKTATCSKCGKRFRIPAAVASTPVPAQTAAAATEVPQRQPPTHRAGGQSLRASALQPVAAGAAASPPKPKTPAASAPTPRPATSATPASKPSPRETAGGDFHKARAAAVMAGFSGSFKRPRPSLAYRLGLIASAAAMLMLPLLYFAFVAAIGWLVWLHLANNHVLVTAARGRGVIVAAGIYLGVAVSGVITVLFLLKPLLAPPSRQYRTRSLTPQGEPLLFEFVKRICRDVGAAVPKRIDVDSQVNASASFRRGWISMLFGRDLVLTIGMPLAAGLTLQQFAGVLAHEFGHFAQGAGMRVSAVLRSISLWFERSVYQRDAWDEWLEETAAESDWRISIFLYLAQAAVWVSRKILWCLLMLGRLLTGVMSHQMEYDADRYEVAMVGPDAFASTFRRLRQLAIGESQAHGVMNRSFADGFLPEDIPKLVVSEADQLPPGAVEAINALVADAKSSIFSSHPSDAARIAAARRRDTSPAFTADLPASAVFRHFEAACKGTTQDLYKIALGNQASKLRLVPTDTLIQASGAEQQAFISLHDYFGGAWAPDRIFPLPAPEVRQPADFDTAVRVLKKAREAVAGCFADYVTAADLREKQRQLENARGRYGRLTAGLPAANRHELAAAEMQFAEASKEADRRAPPDPQRVERFPPVAGKRLHTALCLMHHPMLVSLVSEPHRKKQAIAKVLPAALALDSALPKVLQLDNELRYFQFTASHFEKNSENLYVLERMFNESSSRMVELIKTLRGSWLGLPYPFDHADAGMTVGKALTPDLLVAEEFGDVVSAASTLLEGFGELRARCWARLVSIAVDVENALELPPLDLKAE